MTIMFKYSFLILTVLFFIFSFSTGLAHPIPDSTSQAGRRNLMLMGRAVHYAERDVAMTPRDSDEQVTRGERFRHRLIHRQLMQTPDGWISSA